MPSWPFRLQPPHVPRPRFRTLPLSAGRFPASPQVEISPLPEQAHHARQAESSSFPTDWSVPFDCSPPRLTATQLSLGTGRRAFARRGLPPLSHGAIAGALGPRAARGLVNRAIPPSQARRDCTRACDGAIALFARRRPPAAGVPDRCTIRENPRLVIQRHTRRGRSAAQVHAIVVLTFVVAQT